MKRSLGRRFSINRKLGGRAACLVACLLLPQAGALAQAPEQHWQPAQNYPANNPPNYQPSTAAADPPAAGYPGGGSPPPAGQNQPGQNPQQNNQYPQYPRIEERQALPAGQQGYGYPPAGAAPAGNPSPPDSLQYHGPSGANPLQVRNDAPKAPFVLSPAEAAALDRLLTDWEKRNKEIHVLESEFYRWKYDAVFGDAKKPQPFDKGILKFAAPDKGLMKIEAKDPKQSEQWLCDGKSIYQFDYTRNLVTEYVMPPELQGKGIGDGPLPFVFGIEAEKLKQRYFMKITTPPNVQDEVWLVAYPRYRQQAAEFSRVEVILKIAGANKSLLPFAINIYASNEKDHTVYQLQDPKINRRVIFGGVFGSWWEVSIPFGWTKKTELPPPPIQAGLTPSMTPRQ